MTLYELLEKHEGRRNTPYKCPAGKLTIGVGHNIDANGLPNDIDLHLKKFGTITDDMINRLLEADVRQTIADCRVLFPEFNTFSARRKFALIDFVFQLGRSKALSFVHSIACINTGRWETAGEQMRKSKWAQQTPNRAQEIIEMIEVG